MRSSRSLFREFFEGHHRLRPLQATWLGLRTHDARLEDLSSAALARQAAFYRSRYRRLDKLRPGTAAEALDARNLASKARFCLHLLTESPEHGVSLELIFDVYETLSFQAMRAKEPAHWRALQSRLEAMPRFLGQLEANIRRRRPRLDRRFVADTLEALPEVARQLQGPLYAAAGPRLQPRLKAAGGRAAEALFRLVLWLDKDVLPRTGEAFALGPREYGWRLEHGLGFKGGIGAAETAGRRMLRTIHARMRAIARGLGKKDLAALVHRLARKAPSDDRAMLAMYRGFTQRAQRFVRARRLFATAPGYRLAIEPVPPGLGAALTTAMYFPAPPLDPATKGVFLVAMSGGIKEKLLAHNHYHALSTAVHEAFPGHDMQYFLWQGDRSIPPWRHLHGDPKDWSSSMNVEGYAHYAEELMREHGFYRPKEELFQLAGQAWRAARIVVDCGLHSGRMSFEQSVRFLQTQAFLDRTTAEGETFRYTKWPTQAVTYSLGKAQIEDLKTRLRREWGAGFSEARFHSYLLAFGPLPLSLIEGGFVIPLRARRPAPYNKARA